MAQSASLAALGEWEAIDVPRRAHSIIRHSYEEVLTAAARLASFATGQPTRTLGPIDNRQEALAAADLIHFAINARRLMDNTVKKAPRFRRVVIRSFNKPPIQYISVRRVINTIIHHEDIEIFRTNWQRLIWEGKFPDNNQPDSSFPPLVIVVSRDDRCSFALLDLVETFQVKILEPVMELCSEHHLFLEDDL